MITREEYDSVIMATMLILSSTLIALALVFYSIGVWSERIARYLKPWHVIAFWTGFLFDVSGTLAMHRLAKGPFDLRAPHTLTREIVRGSCSRTPSGAPCPCDRSEQRSGPAGLQWR